MLLGSAAPFFFDNVAYLVDCYKFEIERDMPEEYKRRIPTTVLLESDPMKRDMRTIAQIAAKIK